MRKSTVILAIATAIFGSLFATFHLQIFLILGIISMIIPIFTETIFSNEDFHYETVSSCIRKHGPIIRTYSDDVGVDYYFADGYVLYTCHDDSDADLEENDD